MPTATSSLVRSFATVLSSSEWISARLIVLSCNAALQNDCVNDLSVSYLRAVLLACNVEISASVSFATRKASIAFWPTSADIAAGDTKPTALLSFAMGFVEDVGAGLVAGLAIEVLLFVETCFAVIGNQTYTDLV